MPTTQHGCSDVRPECTISKNLLCKGRHREVCHHRMHPFKLRNSYSPTGPHSVRLKGDLAETIALGRVSLTRCSFSSIRKIKPIGGTYKHDNVGLLATRCTKTIRLPGNAQTGEVQPMGGTGKHCNAGIIAIHCHETTRLPGNIQTGVSPRKRSINTTTEEREGLRKCFYASFSDINTKNK